jgi:hypothetical protein
MGRRHACRPGQRSAELLAVDGSTNEAKGDGDAATWLPPNKAYRCAYVARQVAVKARYRLWVTQAEHDAIARVLTSCPGQRVPVEGGAPPATAPTATRAASSTSVAPPPPAGGSTRVVALIGRAQLCSPAAPGSRSWAAREIGKRNPNPIMSGYVDGDFVVAAAQVLHERMTGRDGRQ